MMSNIVHLVLVLYICIMYVPNTGILKILHNSDLIVFVHVLVWLGWVEFLLSWDEGHQAQYLVGSNSVIQISRICLNQMEKHTY